MARPVQATTALVVCAVTFPQVVVYLFHTIIISKDYQKQLEDIEQQKNIYARKDGKINPILVKN